MSIDAQLLIGLSAAVTTKALMKGRTKQEHVGLVLGVRALGPDACLLSTPFRAPMDAEEAAAIVTWARAHVPAKHADRRGVLAFPDEVEMNARTYAGAVRAAGAAGFWLSLRGKRVATRSEAAVPARKTRALTTPTRSPRGAAKTGAGGPNWACLVLRSPARVRDRHPGVRRVTRLSDGAALVVVNELYVEHLALLRLLVEYYPDLAVDAFSPPGLLVLPMRRHQQAAKLAGYDAVATALAKGAPTSALDAPNAPAFFLRLDGVPNLEAEITRRRDAAWDQVTGERLTALLTTPSARASRRT